MPIQLFIYLHKKRIFVMIEIIIKADKMTYIPFVSPCNQLHCYSLIINHVSF